MDRAYAWLRQHRVQHASPAPQRLPDWNPNAAGIRAFYFKDPDGHFLEILWFPPDKGDARWHRPTNRLFLGIDHTAIVVADTDRSLSCYRDTLGLRVVGGSENYGPEQERLNNVFGARLRITTLRAAAGPGIEFLEYLTPRDGRPVPQDARANDLAHWQTALVADDAEGVHRLLRGSACAPLSPGVVASGEPGAWLQQGLSHPGPGRPCPGGDRTLNTVDAPPLTCEVHRWGRSRITRGITALLLFTVVSLGLYLLARGVLHVTTGTADEHGGAPSVPGRRLVPGELLLAGLDLLRLHRYAPLQRVQGSDVLPDLRQRGDPPFYRDPAMAFHRYITMLIVSTLSAFLAVLVTFAPQ